MSIPRFVHSSLQAGNETSACGYFEDFLRRRLVGYVDANEEDNSHIAFYGNQIEPMTDLGIEPLTILSAVAGLIPYPPVAS